MTCNIIHYIQHFQFYKAGKEKLLKKTKETIDKRLGHLNMFYLM